jgi:hypothetical protein
VLFYFYFAVENDVICYSQINNNIALSGQIVDPTTTYTDVSSNFNIVILALFVSTSLDMIYEIVHILSIYHKNLKAARNLLRLKDIITFAVVIMIHYYRLNYAGKVCSGDYLIGNSYD